VTGWQRTSWIPTDRLPEGLSHLALPLLVPTRETGIQLCFANARDAKNRSHPVCATVSLNDSGDLHLEDSWRVIATPGSAGHFDENGLTVSDVQLTSSGYECLTFGWRLRQGGGWFNEIGELLLDLDLNVLSRSSAPTLERTSLDPISLAYPSFGPNLEIFYNAPSRLCEKTGKPLDFQILRRDADGIRTTVADPKILREQSYFAFTRPWILMDGGVCHMWFCARGDRYRILHAVQEGIDRNVFSVSRFDDFVGLPNIFEDSSACYPSVSVVGELAVMLYNGAGYGASGIGVATRHAGDVYK